MSISRRNVLMSTLFGAGYVGLRALATGIPAGVLLRGSRALASDPAMTCANKQKAQYVIMQTSSNGDPLNANAPGTYATTGPLSTIAHNPDTMLMAPTALALRGKQTMAAAPWAALDQRVLDRMGVWHIMTNTPVHPREPDVLGLLGATTPNEMLPSLLAKQLAPCLGTIQNEPITLGATSPSEGLRFEGRALPIIPPLALKATLTNPAGPLAGITNLQKIRDQTLAQIDAIYRSTATKAQAAYVDELITSQSQVRSINQDLLSALAAIKDNSVASQIAAAVILFQMNVSPVIAIHIPFGGDNHNDTGLVTEAAQTVSGLATIGAMMTTLGSTPAVNGATGKMIDQVSFVSLNVFGRTIGPANTDGRQHNPNHQVSLTIGKHFAGGVIGGVEPVGTDFGALPIDGIAPIDTLGAFGKTVMAAVGIDQDFIDKAVSTGKVVPSALA